MSMTSMSPKEEFKKKSIKATIFKSSSYAFTELMPF